MTVGPATEQWVRVADVADLPPETCTRITYAGVDIAVFNVEGTYYAIGDTCTHAEASLSEGDFYTDADRCEWSHDPASDLTVKAFAWPMLLQAAGLAGTAGQKLQLTPAGRTNAPVRMGQPAAPAAVPPVTGTNAPAPAEQTK